MTPNIVILTVKGSFSTIRAGHDISYKSWPNFAAQTSSILTRCPMDFSSLVHACSSCRLRVVTCRLVASPSICRFSGSNAIARLKNSSRCCVVSVVICLLVFIVLTVSHRWLLFVKRFKDQFRTDFGSRTYVLTNYFKAGSPPSFLALTSWT